MSLEADLQHAQRVRDSLLGSRAHPKRWLQVADKALAALLRDASVVELLSSHARCDSYVPHIIPLFVWWYVGEDACVEWFREHPWRSGDPRQPDEETLRSRLKPQGLNRLTQARLVLFREAFISAHLSDDHWAALGRLCDMGALRAYAESGCATLDLDSTHYFYHDTWGKRFRFLPPVDEQDSAVVLHPVYEGEVIGFLLALIASACGAMLGVEYERWRKRRAAAKVSAEEARARLDRVEEKVQATQETIAQMLLESRLRYTLLLDNIGGTVARRELKALYIDVYLPVIEGLRASRGHDCPSELRGLQQDCRMKAHEMTPETKQLWQLQEELRKQATAVRRPRCTSRTRSGERCSRLAAPNSERCWQHQRRSGPK